MLIPPLVIQLHKLYIFFQQFARKYTVSGIGAGVDFTMHNSSTTAAVCGSSSLTQVLFLPWMNTDLPLSEIAAETGFENLQYFTRIFKEKAGQTPGEYKKNHRLL